MKYSEMLDNNLPVLVYAGEFDMKDGPRTQVGWMRAIDNVNKNDKDYWLRSRKIYFI